MIKSGELLFTILAQGKAVSIVRAGRPDDAIHIAESMLEFCMPDHEPLQARMATASESSRFFVDACAWSGGVALAGIVLDNHPTSAVH